MIHIRAQKTSVPERENSPFNKNPDHDQDWDQERAEKGRSLLPVDTAKRKPPSAPFCLFHALPPVLSFFGLKINLLAK